MPLYFKFQFVLCICDEIGVCVYFTVDVTTYHRGFHGDLNETMFVGAVPEKAKLLVQTTHGCLARAIAAGTSSSSLRRLLQVFTSCCFHCTYNMCFCISSPSLKISKAHITVRTCKHYMGQSKH